MNTTDLKMAVILQASLSSLAPILFEQGHARPFEEHQSKQLWFTFCCDDLNLVAREGFALLALEPDTVISHSTNSRPKALLSHLNHQTSIWWPLIWAREVYMKMETESYLLAFDPRWAWKAYEPWITLYNRNIQNHCVSPEHDTGL